MVTDEKCKEEEEEAKEKEEYASSTKVLKIWRVSARGLFRKRLHYKIRLEAKVSTQTEEVLSGEQEESEISLMKREHTPLAASFGGFWPLKFET